MSETIALFGATGATGRFFTNIALGAGHKLVALARSPAALEPLPMNLFVVHGDLTSYSDVESVFNQHNIDVVVFVAGIASLRTAMTKPTTVYSVGGGNVLKCVEKFNIKKTIFLTSAAINPDPNLPWIYRNVIRNWVIGMYNDQKRLEAMVESLPTTVNWIIVRCPWLRDDIQKEETKVHEACLAKGKAMIRREDVASFIFQQISSDDWMHKKPTITY